MFSITNEHKNFYAPVTPKRFFIESLQFNPVGWNQDTRNYSLE